MFSNFKNKLCLILCLFDNIQQLLLHGSQTPATMNMGSPPSPGFHSHLFLEMPLTLVVVTLACQCLGR